MKSACCRNIKPVVEGDSIEKQLTLQMETLTLHDGDLLVVRCPRSTTISEGYRLQDAFTDIVQRSGVRVQVVLLNQDTTLETLNAHQLARLGLQRIKADGQT